MKKKLLNTVHILLFLFISFNLYADKKSKIDKQKAKAAKQEVKKYLKDPLSFINMKKNYEKEIEKKTQSLESLNKKYADAVHEVERYEDSLEYAKLVIKQKDTELKGVLNTAEKELHMYTDVGTEYRVQIGVYKTLDFTKLIDLNQPIGYVRNGDEIHYFIGSWNNPEEAYNFAQNLKKISFKDAFVTKYVDGVRTPYNYLKEH